MSPFFSNINYIKLIEMNSVKDLIKSIQSFDYEDTPDTFKHELFEEGEPMDEKQRQSISVGRKGQPCTDSAKEKHRQARLGWIHTDLVKNKISKSMSKLSYLITTPNNKKIITNNLRQFAKKNGLDQGNLTKVAQGKLKQHKKYTVSYNG